MLALAAGFQKNIEIIRFRPALELFKLICLIMGSIPMYDAVEFLSNGDQSGIIGFGSFGRVRDCFHRKLGRVAIKCFGIEGNAHDAEELRHK